MTSQQEMSHGSSEMIGVSLGDQEFMELSYWDGCEEPTEDPTDTAWSDSRKVSTGINGFKNEEEKATRKQDQKSR